MRVFIVILFCFGNTLSFAQPLKVVDFVGREVILSVPAKRIVALAPHIVENVFSAGAGESLVGVVSYSNYPVEAKKLPIVGGYNSFSLETILALKPDLVLMWASAAGSGMSKLQALSAMGIPVYVDELSDIKDVVKFINDIGVLTDNVDVANRAALEFLNNLNSIREKYSRLSPVSVFYQVWNEPLQTINGQHVISDVIELCGGINIFSEAIAIAPKVGLETIFAQDPQVIIASGMDEARPEWLDEWLAWPQLSAVKNSNLFFVPPDLLQRHTVRMLEGAEQVCHHLQRARREEMWAR